MGMTLWESVRLLLTATLSTEASTLDAVSAFMIMSCFLGKYVKITAKRFWILHGFGGAVFIYNLVCFFARFGSTVDNESTYAINLSLIIYLYIFVCACIFYGEKAFLRAVEVFVVFYFYSMYSDVIVYNIFGIAVGNPLLVNSNLAKANSQMAFFYCICRFMLSTVALLIFYFGLYKAEISLRLKFHEMAVLIAWLTLMWFFGGWVTGVYKEQVSKISILILFPLMSVFLPILLLMNRYRNLLRDKNAYQQTYLEAELAYVEQYKEAQTQTRAFRHDIINQLSLLDMLMHEGKTEEAQAQLDQLLGEVRDLSPKYITGDQMLDCIVAMKAARMEEKGISFTMDGVLDGGLNMKPMDVCSIFANAMDNAMEAVTKIEPGSGQENNALEGQPERSGNQRWIDLKIKRTERFFAIKISNATVGKAKVERMFEGRYTSKKDSEHHGFGLQNICKAAERYDGMVKAEAEEGRFSLSIMVPRKADGEK